MSCDCFTIDGREPYAANDNYYCPVCKKGMGNAYYAAASERDRLRADVEQLRGEVTGQESARTAAEAEVDRLLWFLKSVARTHGLPEHVKKRIELEAPNDPTKDWSPYRLQMERDGARRERDGLADELMLECTKNTALSEALHSLWGLSSSIAQGDWVHASAITETFLGFVRTMKERSERQTQDDLSQEHRRHLVGRLRVAAHRPIQNPEELKRLLQESADAIAQELDVMHETLMRERDAAGTEVRRLQEECDELVTAMRAACAIGSVSPLKETLKRLGYTAEGT